MTEARVVDEIWELGDALYNRLKTRRHRGQNLAHENHLGNAWPSARDRALEKRLIKWFVRCESD